MYEVSSAFAAQTAHAREEDLIIYREDPSESYTTADILAGSVSFSGQCSDSEVCVGGVYINEMKFSTIPLPSNRYPHRGERLSAVYRLKVGNSWEKVPVGVYVVSDVNKGVSGAEIKCYDLMSTLDVKLDFDTSNASMWSILQAGALVCGYELGMSQLDFERLPNGQQRVTIYTENNLETWRDLISCIAQVTCTFATFDRDGALVFRRFGHAGVVRTFSGDTRLNGGTYSNYNAHYTALSIAQKDGTRMLTHDPETDTGLTMFIDDNPLLWLGSRYKVSEVMLRAIISDTADMTPATLVIPSAPELDLGDMVRYDVAGPKLIVMSYQWNFGKDMTLKCYGKDPKTLPEQSAEEKEITNLEKNIARKGISFYAYTNTEALMVPDGSDGTLFSIMFTTTEDTRVLINSQSIVDTLLTSEGVPATAKVTYYVNGSEVQTIHPVDTWEASGKHLLTLFHHMEVDADKVYTVIAKLEMDGGSAEVAPFETEAVITGQGMAATPVWDGLIELDQSIRPLAWPTQEIAEMDAEMHITSDTPKRSTASDSVGVFIFSEQSLAGMDVSIEINLEEE